MWGALLLLGVIAVGVWIYLYGAEGLREDAVQCMDAPVGECDSFWRLASLLYTWAYHPVITPLALSLIPLFVVSAIWWRSKR